MAMIVMSAIWRRYVLLPDMLQYSISCRRENHKRDSQTHLGPWMRLNVCGGEHQMLFGTTLPGLPIFSRIG